VHPSGEVVTYNAQEGEPFTLPDCPFFYECVTDAAIGALVFRHWDAFGRHVDRRSQDGVDLSPIRHRR
jgi:hypothetical protein